MKSNHFKVGLLVSTAWLAAAVVVLWLKRTDLESMTPNAWGDYLAGFFSPLALTWLVLGYLQQGRELAVSSEAMRLQAEELRNSVQQQTELARTAKAQLELERDANQDARAERELELTPQILIVPLGSFRRLEFHTEYTLEIINYGHVAFGFRANLILPNSRRQQMFETGEFPRGDRYSCSFAVREGEFVHDSKIELTYINRLGNYEVRYLRIENMVTEEGPQGCTFRLSFQRH